ncbi:uncharacterized protein [Eurosta solidaginis]|uniref:uncharacterized protein isoform X2 n=1 Tax=Eurosta solidaginis TaxID=178769 RepID=UPI0035313DB1
MNKDHYSGDEAKQNSQNHTTASKMAVQIIGSVPHYRHEDNNWNVFRQQLNQFFIANEITDDKRKKAIFLTSIGEVSYILLQNLMCPQKVDDAATTFKSCVEVMDAHFKPPASAFAERYKFYEAKKMTTESINEWAVRVRSLSLNCEFGACLSDTLRDKFIMGLEKGPARDKIFMETIACDFKKAVDIANTTEYIYTQRLGDSIKEEPQEALNYVQSKGKKVQQQQQPPQQSNEQRRQQKQPQSANKGSKEKRGQQRQGKQCTSTNEAAKKPAELISDLLKQVHKNANLKTSDANTKNNQLNVIRLDGPQRNSNIFRWPFSVVVY